MRTLLLALVGFLFVARANSGLWEATVSGTAVYQESRGSNTILRTENVNTARIFREFQVTPEDYLLVTDARVGILYLIPRHTEDAPPADIPVLHNFEGLARTLIRTGPPLNALGESPAFNTNAPGTIFDQFRGTVIINTRERIVGGKLIVTGRMDVVGSSSTRILKLKITMGKELTTPAPL